MVSEYGAGRVGEEVRVVAQSSSRFCNNCGLELEGPGRVCPSCGAVSREPGVEPPTAAVPAVAFDGDEAPRGAERARSAGPTLEVLRGRNAGARFVLTHRHVIGRAPESAIFLDDVTVSRQHAVADQAMTGVVTIQDLGSRNGTYVNGLRVEEVQLSNGDIVQIGVYKLVFDGSPEAP